MGPGNLRVLDSGGCSPSSLPTIAGLPLDQPLDKLPTVHFQELKRLEAWYWWHQGRFNVGREWLALDPSTRFADVGCGMGGFLEHVRQGGGPSGVGFDASPSALESVRAMGFEARNLEFPSTTALEGSPWDALSCMDVMEHVEDHRQFLDCLRSSLGDGGRLFLTVPAFQSLFSSWDTQLGHYRRYEPRDIKPLFGKSGFKVERMTCLFSWAWLPALLRRRKSSNAIEFPQVPMWLNSVLLGATRLEGSLGKRWCIPVGTSIAVRARAV